MQEISVLASHALMAQKRFTAVADNVANVNTAGFRKLEIDQKEITSGRSGTSYVADRSITISPQSGVLETTGNPFDVAISGQGFFAIQMEGGIHYTRRGQFMLNADGTLVTPEGEPVLDNANAQIQFPADTRSVKIAADGTISTEQGILAQIGVFTFTPADAATLVRTGNTSFASATGAAPQVVEYPVVRQGMVEASNVNAVQEMVDMQTVSQAYQNSMNLLGTLGELESRTIRTLGATQ